MGNRPFLNEFLFDYLLRISIHKSVACTLKLFAARGGKSPQAEHAQSARRIRFMHERALTQITFPLLIFTGENVTMAAAIAFDFARARHAKALLRAAIGFQFRHFNLSYFLTK